METIASKQRILHLFEVTPEQVQSIDTLKGKALHITMDNDSITTLGAFLDLYRDLVTTYVRQNNIKKLDIQIKVTNFKETPNKTIIILNKLA